MFDARDHFIDLFEKGIFPYKESEEEWEENKSEKIKDDYKIFFKHIEDELWLVWKN